MPKLVEKPEIVFPFNVTVPASWVKILPFKVAPEFIAFMPSNEKMFPLNCVFEPRVIELPTLHQILQASPPVIDELDEVMIVVSLLKIQTPEPIKFKFPDSVKLLVEQYVPGPTPDGNVAVRSTAPNV